MSPEGWQRVKELFEAALEREGSERGAFIQQACERDATTGAELKRLLAEHEQAGSFLEQRQILGYSALADNSEISAAGDIAPGYSAEDSQGRRVGPYRTLREIGHGGMGTVYLSERADGQYRKRVAIKLVNPHLGTEEILRRFRNERQVLAALDHPHIARLLDGGTTEDGRPYLVMEYVEGMPIHAWCDSRKLGVRDRLRLFRKVCAAVQYAHDKEVIHRDIKPSNILVTTEGSPQLMDFGIAKVLSRELSAVTLETATGSGPMTPEYASPEQIRGEAVGPASDIYSLGVVLYQLLTGQLPYAIQAHELGRLTRIICEQEPVKPSAAATLNTVSELRGESATGLRRLLAGDLDHVVLKALRKEPERRYASVAQFSDDIDRFLQDLPVRARRESLSYRGLKFLKRNRVPALAAVVGAALVAAIVVGLGRFAVSTSGTNPVKARSTVSNGTTPLRWEDMRFEKIATLGDPAPGGGSFMRDFEPWGLNNRGDLAFAADVSVAREGVFLLRRGGSAVQLARGGQPAPGGGTFDRDIAGYTSINDAGDVAFVFGLKTSNPPQLKDFLRGGLFRYSQADQKLSPVVIPGVTLAPGFGVFQSTGMHPMLNSSGDIVFPGLVRTASGVSRGHDFGQGIFLTDRNGRITKVVAPGDPAPGGGKFDFAQNPWINDRGDVAFGAHVAGDECIAPSRFGCNESIYLKAAANGIVESIAHQREQGPLATTYRYAWGPVLNNRGDLVFMGDLTPLPGVRANRGIFLYSRGINTPIALPGDTMPDGRKIATVNPAHVIGNYSLNNHGDVSFNASLENGESAFYIYSQGLLHLAFGTGTIIPNVGTISSVASLLINGGMLNDSGQIFFWATLTDGRGVLLLATPTAVAANSNR